MSDVEKYVFVTGASRGIGAATAKALATRGHSVGIGVREKIKKADEVADSLEEINPLTNTEVFAGDITDPVELHRILAEVNFWAAHQLGGLVLNAAGGLERGKSPDYGLQINRDSQ